tara:strand:- start:25082 stop:26236 length:1155 start_codon:yes stop_codon:yes gene_type:complete
MSADDTDYTKFPIVARDTIFEVGDNTFNVENKFPLTDSPFGSRLASQIALPISERQNTKNYHLLGFAPQRALQAEDLNEIQERFMVDNTLTQQMWSNWNSQSNLQSSEFGPGWFGATPMYPHEWKSHIRYLDELIYAPANADDLIYEKPKSLVEVNYRVKTEGVVVATVFSTFDVQVTFNPGWYYINDTYTTSSTHDSSGLKYWYYLKEAIHSERIVIQVSAQPFSGAEDQNYNVTDVNNTQEISLDPSDAENNQLCFGLILDDFSYVSGQNFGSGNSDSGADRVEIKVKPKLGCGVVGERTPSYIGHINFGAFQDEIDGGGVGVNGPEVGLLRAYYSNGLTIYDRSTGVGNPDALIQLNNAPGSALDYDDFEDAFPAPTTEFV